MNCQQSNYVITSPGWWVQYGMRKHLVVKRLTSIDKVSEYDEIKEKNMYHISTGLFSGISIE